MHFDELECLRKENNEINLAYDMCPGKANNKNQKEQSNSEMTNGIFTCDTCKQKFNYETD